VCASFVLKTRRITATGVWFVNTSTKNGTARSKCITYEGEYRPILSAHLSGCSANQSFANPLLNLIGRGSSHDARRTRTGPRVGLAEAWYQFMKLRETLDAILAGMDAVTPQTENSPQEAPQPGRHLRLVEATRSPDIAQRHQAGAPVRL
jgi:hypothetical protein